MINPIGSTIVTIEDMVMRLHRPSGDKPFPIVLMLHGWTGDENSMWVFAQRLPRNALIIAPRGIYPNQGNGFSWHPTIPRRWPWVNDFLPAVEKLFTIISGKNFPDGDFSRLHLLGFSQGTALAYTLTMVYPERITSLAGLSGFLPDGSDTWLGHGRLNGLPIFIAHGTEDDMVPVDIARASVDKLEKAGAKVTYCEDTVGHKLSAKCFHGLEAFYNQVNC